VTTTHDPNITVNVYLSASPVQRASFSIPMYIVPLATNSLDGNRTVTYANVTDAAADETSGFISSQTLAVITRAFTQNPKPASFKVGYIDLVGVETYSAALIAIIADDPDFYIPLSETRVAADIVDISAAVEAQAKKMLYISQSADADWITSGVPAGFSTIVTNERTGVLYHDTDANPNAEGWASAVAVFDSDIQSAPWTRTVKSGDVLATQITEAERQIIFANFANVGLPYGASNYFVDSGQSITGRPIYEQVTADWFATRIAEDVAELVQATNDLGQKIPVSAAGQVRILAILKSRLAQGQQAGHFDPDPDEVSAVAEDITATDETNQRMRFTVRAKSSISARIFTFDVYSSTTSIQ